MNVDYDEARRWLLTVHATSPGLIWVGSTDNMAGFTSSDVESALRDISNLERENPKGIYLRTTTLSRIPIDDEGKRGRGTEEDSFTLPGFAADLDIAGPGHATKKLLPPDEATAVSIVAESGLPEPTIWVHSGGGLYPWWLLDDPQDIRDPEALKRAKALSEKIQKILVHAGEQLGWHVGGEVGDMARILRIPGTINRKEGLSRPCRIIEPPSYEHYAYAEIEAIVEAIFDAIPKPEPREFTKTTRPLDANGGQVILPGDDLNARGDWNWILQGHYEYVETKGGTDYWRRVGSASGARHNATTGHARDEDRFYTWSPESVFEPRKPYNKHAAYTLINFGSLSAEAFRQSTKQLAAEGFGSKLPQRNRAVDVTSLVRPAAQMPVAVQAVDDEQPAQAVLPVEANKALPVLDHDGLPVFSTDIFTRHRWRETGLLSIFADAYSPGLRYISNADVWRIWDGKRWNIDLKLRHKLAAQRLIEAMENYADRVNEANPEIGKGMMGAVKKFGTLQKMAALSNAVKARQEISADERDFDRHDRYVTLDNGVLDLENLDLLDFDPDLMLTKKMNCSYDPDFHGPRLEKFLSEIQPNRAVLDYMGRCVAATLLGKADERIIMMLYGGSGSGKSAFLEMLYAVLGDYATIADESTLKPLPDSYQGPSEKLHSLMGTRFVKMSEISQGSSLNESLVKTITGSDTQKTRPLYGKLVEWKVQYTVWMATNHLPRLSSNDGAIWNRVKPILFPGKFIDETGQVGRAEDRDLGRKIAAEEGPAVLNWILGHLRDYLANGLQEPAEIGQWLNDYRDEVDTTRQFMAEAQENGQIEVVENKMVGARELYKVYDAWCVDAQVRFPLSLNNFKARMLANGYRQERKEKGMMWMGVGIAGFIAQAQTPARGNQWMGRQRN